MFTICSLFVHYMFTICSLYVHYMFTISSQYVHNMVTICSLYLHYIFTIYSLYSLYIHYMFTICSLYVHYMFTICSLYVHYMFIICSLYVHYMFTICSLCIFGKLSSLPRLATSLFADTYQQARTQAPAKSKWGKKERRGNRLVGFAQSWIFFNEKVCTEQIFAFVPGFFGNRHVGSLMESKMEDVINHYNLKFRSTFILIQPNPRVPQRSKFWPHPIQTSSLIFMTVRTQQVYFPTSFPLGPADRFLAVLCVCRGLFGNRLVASLIITFRICLVSRMSEFSHCFQ